LEGCSDKARHTGVSTIQRFKGGHFPKSLGAFQTHRLGNVKVKLPLNGAKSNLSCLKADLKIVNCVPGKEAAQNPTEPDSVSVHRNPLNLLCT
jgi:hypothetical protein